MVEIIWKEPPPAVSSEKAAILAELQKNPGRWALVQERYKSSSGTAPWKKLGCEATHRRAEPNPAAKSTEYDIYARWPEETKSAAGEKPEPKAAVAKAVATGTALKPPPPAVPKAPKQPLQPANDMGLNKFLADRRARGAVDRAE